MPRALWLVAFAFAVCMMGTTLPTPLYPLYQQKLGLNALTITVVFAIYAIGVIVGLLLFGRLSDAVGRKRVLRVALWLSFASAIAFVVARDLPLVYLGRVLSGLSAGIFTGSGTAYVVELAAPEVRVRAATVAVAANMGGLALGTLLSGILGEYAPFPLQLVYAVDAALVLLALGALALAPETVQATGSFALRVQTLRVPREVRGVFIPAALAGVCSFAVSGVFSSVAPSFLAHVLGEHNLVFAGLLVFVLMGMTAAGQLVVPRFDPGHSLLGATVLLLVGIGLLAMGVALHVQVLLFASAIVEGFGQGLAIGAGLSEINARLTGARGEVTSAYFVAIYLGLSLPVVGVGLLADLAGLQQAALWFCALIAAALLANLVLQVRLQKG